MVKDSLIKNPVVPGSTDGQQTEELPTFTESELEAKFAADAQPAGSELVVTDGAPDGRMVVPASVHRPRFSKEFLEQNPDLQVAFAQSQMQSRGGTTTPASGQPTGDTPVVQPAADTAGVVTTGAADVVTTPNADPNASANIQDGKIAKMNEVLDPVTGKPKQGTTPETKQGEVKTTPSQHLADWGKESFADVVNGSGKDVPISRLIQDHLQWCKENGVMPDLWTINSIVNKAGDVALSAVDNEKAKKRAERKAKFDQVGQFLLHLGNAIGNVAGGGYASMKLEDPVQWTERQRLLKEKADQQRIANNNSVWAQMQKERAEQRTAEMEKRRQDRLDKETKIRQEKNDAYVQAQRAAMAKNEAQVAYWEAKAHALEQGLPLEEALKKAELAKKEAETRLANTRANAGGFAPQRPLQTTETTTTTTDAYGGTKTTKTVKGPAGQKGKSSNNTPPSRRKTSNTNNTPPSRRQQ